ncbi:restriction endonuclease subunit S [Vibrio alginolyticus]
MTSRYKPYSDYISSKVDWIGDIPKHWEVKRLKNVFDIKKRIAGQLGFDVLSVTQKGIVVKDILSGDGQLSMDYSKYQLVFEGDFAMNHMDLLTGYVDISKFNGVTSPDYRVFSLKDRKNYNDRYYLYLLQMCYKQKVFFPLGQGSAHLGRWRLPTEAFNEVIFPYPDAMEQQQIAHFLDHQIEKIDILISKQEELVNLLKEKRHSLVYEAIGTQCDTEVRLGSLVNQYFREFDRSQEEMVVALGLYNRGRGIFKKEPKLPQELGESDFFHVQDGDLLISGQFAWEGAIALADKRHCNCVVSHRYPILKGRDGLIDTKYLWAYLTTKEGDFLLNECSVGSAGRNRPLNIKKLLKEKVPLPCIKSQLEVSKFVQAEKEIRQRVDLEIDLLNERKTALISAAVTGKIDVRDWYAQGVQG